MQTSEPVRNRQKGPCPVPDAGTSPETAKGTLSSAGKFPYGNDKECRRRNQSGTGKRGSYPVPECSGTEMIKNADAGTSPEPAKEDPVQYRNAQVPD
jgi:hypothetical protein